MEQLRDALVGYKPTTIISSIYILDQVHFYKVVDGMMDEAHSFVERYSTHATRRAFCFSALDLAREKNSKLRLRVPRNGHRASTYSSELAGADSSFMLLSQHICLFSRARPDGTNRLCLRFTQGYTQGYTGLAGSTRREAECAARRYVGRASFYK
jgi:hypothetical protein